MRKSFIAAAAVAATTVLVGAGVAIRRGRAASVEVAPGPIAETIIAQGQVVATAGTAEVRALVDGRVVEVPLREGDAVAAGQLLARLDTVEIDAAIARADAERRAADAELRLAEAGGRVEERRAATAALDEAKSDLALAQTRADRDTALADKGAVAPAAADESRRAADMARARVSRAEAERAGTMRGRVEQIDAARARLAAAAAALDAARARRDRAVVVAPIAGVVLARHVDVGDSVEPGATLFELADPRATELRVEIEEGDAMRVAPGQPVTVTSRGGATALGQGTIVRVSPRLGARTIGASEARMRAETQVRSAWVRWSDGPAAATGAALPIGLRVEARIALPPHQVAARVPRASVRVDGGVATVEVPRFALTADERAVELGAADERWVEVRGVAAGTPVAGSAP